MNALSGIPYMFLIGFMAVPENELTKYMKPVLMAGRLPLLGGVAISQ
ncbi:hypothetical protein SAMN05216420_10271 [Nitrosospira sp. Nl5]|nr:hypothetical protein SAMN05216420_10271 [Nitrosospira sp. Nl5]